MHSGVFPPGLSKWIRQQVQHHGSFGSALRSLRAFALRNRPGTELPALPAALARGNPQGSTTPLSPDGPAASQEQSLDPEVHCAASISSVHPTARDRPSDSTAAGRQSTFISTGKNGDLNLFWRKQMGF